MTYLPLNIRGRKFEYRLRQRQATVCDVLHHGVVVAQGITFLKPGEENDVDYAGQVAINRAAEALAGAGAIPKRLAGTLGGFMFSRAKLAAAAKAGQGMKRLRQVFDKLGATMGIPPIVLKAELDSVDAAIGPPPDSLKFLNLD
jgi:hypothetical protein